MFKVLLTMLFFVGSLYAEKEPELKYPKLLLGITPNGDVSIHHWRKMRKAEMDYLVEKLMYELKKKEEKDDKKDTDYYC